MAFSPKCVLLEEQLPHVATIEGDLDDALPVVVGAHNHLHAVADAPEVVLREFRGDCVIDPTVDRLHGDVVNLRVASVLRGQ